MIADRQSRLIALLASAVILVSLGVGAQEEPPLPDLMPDLGADPMGNPGDVGTPDPINPAEPTNQPVPQEGFMPDFESAAPTTTPAPAPAASENAEAAPVPTPEVVEAVPAEAAPPPPRRRRWTGGPLPKPRPLSPLANPDDPDFQRERVFFDVYKKYNEDPTPIDRWDQVSGARQSEVYKVQQGDTLWDLSGTLFGDPSFWPKIWALNNDQVHNPHQIETWMQIRFFPGDMDEAPAVTVGDASGQTPAAIAAVASGTDGEATAETSTETQTTMTTDAMKVEKMGPDPKVDASLIPPAKHRPAIVRQIPPSIPFYRYEEVNVPPLDFERFFPPQKPVRHEMPLSYYLEDRAVSGIGKVEETELGGNTASEFQFVFVSVKDPSQRILTVVSDRGTVADVRSGSSKRGPLIEVQGEIELIEPVSERANVFRAIVRRSLTHIEVGGVLVPGRIRMVPVADGTPTEGPNLMVIGAQFANRRQMVDAGGFVFLNGGEAQGARVGQILPLYSNQRLRNPDTVAKNNDRMVGHVRIVHVSQQFSTGFVTRLWDDVFIGDATFNAAGRVSRSTYSSDEASLRSGSGSEASAFDDFGDDDADFKDFGDDGDDGDELTL